MVVRPSVVALSTLAGSFILLTSCFGEGPVLETGFGDTNTAATCGDFSGFLSNESFNVSIQGQGGAFQASPLDESIYYNLHGSISFQNRSTTTDCMLALYISNEEGVPSAELLPALDPGVTPPASVEGLGNLEFAVILPYEREHSQAMGGEFALELSAYHDDLESGAPITFTAVTCDDSDISMQLSFWYGWCGDGNAETGPAEGWQLRSLW